MIRYTPRKIASKQYLTTEFFGRKEFKISVNIDENGKMNLESYVDKKTPRISELTRAVRIKRFLDFEKSYLKLKTD